MQSRLTLAAICLGLLTALLPLDCAHAEDPARRQEKLRKELNAEIAKRVSDLSLQQDLRQEITGPTDSGMLNGVRNILGIILLEFDSELRKLYSPFSGSAEPWLQKLVIEQVDEELDHMSDLPKGKRWSIRARLTMLWDREPEERLEILHSGGHLRPLRPQQTKREIVLLLNLFLDRYLALTANETDLSPVTQRAFDEIFEEVGKETGKSGSEVRRIVQQRRVNERSAKNISHPTLKPRAPIFVAKGEVRIIRMGEKARTLKPKPARPSEPGPPDLAHLESREAELQRIRSLHPTLFAKAVEEWAPGRKKGDPAAILLRHLVENQDKSVEEAVELATRASAIGADRTEVLGMLDGFLSYLEKEFPGRERLGKETAPPSPPKPPRPSSRAENGSPEYINGGRRGSEIPALEEGLPTVPPLLERLFSGKPGEVLRLLREAMHKGVSLDQALQDLRQTLGEADWTVVLAANWAKYEALKASKGKHAFTEESVKAKAEEYRWDGFELIRTAHKELTVPGSTNPEKPFPLENHALEKLQAAYQKDAEGLTRALKELAINGHFSKLEWAILEHFLEERGDLAGLKEQLLGCTDEVIQKTLEKASAKLQKKLPTAGGPPGIARKAPGRRERLVPMAPASDEALASATEEWRTMAAAYGRKVDVTIVDVEAKEILEKDLARVSLTPEGEVEMKLYRIRGKPGQEGEIAQTTLAHEKEVLRFLLEKPKVFSKVAHLQAETPREIYQKYTTAADPTELLAPAIMNAVLLGGVEAALATPNLALEEREKLESEESLRTTLGLWLLKTLKWKGKLPSLDDLCAKFPIDSDVSPLPSAKPISERIAAWTEERIADRTVARVFGVSLRHLVPTVTDFLPGLLISHFLVEGAESNFTKPVDLILADFFEKVSNKKFVAMAGLYPAASWGIQRSGFDARSARILARMTRSSRPEDLAKAITPAFRLGMVFLTIGVLSTSHEVDFILHSPDLTSDQKWFLTSEIINTQLLVRTGVDAMVYLLVPALLGPMVASLGPQALWGIVISGVTLAAVVVVDQILQAILDNYRGEEASAYEVDVARALRGPNVSEERAIRSLNRWALLQGLRRTYLLESVRKEMVRVEGKRLQAAEKVHDRWTGSLGYFALAQIVSTENPLLQDRDYLDLEKTRQFLRMEPYPTVVNTRGTYWNGWDRAVAEGKRTLAGFTGEFRWSWGIPDDPASVQDEEQLMTAVAQAERADAARAEKDYHRRWQKHVGGEASEKLPRAIRSIEEDEIALDEWSRFATSFDRFRKRAQEIKTRITGEKNLYRGELDRF